MRWDDPVIHREQRILSRLRTGHTKASHNMDTTGAFRKICPVYNVTYSVEHFIINCPQHQAARTAHGISNSIRCALNNDIENIKRLMKYLKDIDLYRSI